MSYEVKSIKDNFKGIAIKIKDSDEEKINTSNYKISYKQLSNQEKEIISFSIQKPHEKEYNRNKKKIKNLNTNIILLNIFGFILYIISLYGCHGGAENYCVTTFIKIFIFLSFLDIIDGIIVSITIILIIWKKIYLYHLFYIIIGYSLLYIYDNGTTFNDHGGFSMLIFSLATFLFFTIINHCILIIHSIIKKKKLLLFILFSITISPFIYDFYVTYHSNCDFWDKGLNNSKLINYNNSKCIIKKPPNCKMYYYSGIFDLSQKLPIPNYNKKETAIKYLNKKFKNSNHFGFPYTNKVYFENIFDNFYFHNYVPQNMIDMEKFEETEDNPYPEVTVKYDEKEEGTITINLKRNETLVKERKKLYNNNSLYKNILILFSDSNSRPHFIHSLKNVSNFISKFFTFNQEKNPKNYSSYEFFKFHSLGFYTHINIQPMFYGNSKKSNSGIEFIKYAKENGYITGHTYEHCSHALYNDEKNIGSKNVKSYFWDHENIAMFCDPNYYDKKFASTYNRGPSSFLKRIFYGKQPIEYELEYFKQFWEKYNDVKKVFRLSFMMAHEDTGEVIKYMDEPLSKILYDFYYKGYFDDTLIVFVSDHGLHLPRLYGWLANGNFMYERAFPHLFIISGKNISNFNHNILTNQNKLITPYDIYNTLIHAILGNENYNQVKFESDKGESLFNFIDEEVRGCNFYEELKNNFCKCYK